MEQRTNSTDISIISFTIRTSILLLVVGEVPRYTWKVLLMRVTVVPPSVSVIIDDLCKSILTDKALSSQMRSSNERVERTGKQERMRASEGPVESELHPEYDWLYTFIIKPSCKALVTSSSALQPMLSNDWLIK